MKELELINICNSINYDEMLNYVEKRFKGLDLKRNLTAGYVIDGIINDSVAQYIYDTFGVDLWETEVYNENDELIYDVAFDWFLDYYELYSDEFCKWVSLKIVEKIWSNDSLENFRTPLFNFLTSYPIKDFKI